MTGAPRVETRVRPWEVAAFAAAFAVTLSVALAFVWGGTPAYVSIRGDERATLTDLRTGERVVPIRPPSDLHEGWFAYVTGRSADQPALEAPWFTDDERRHMSDVRGVFIAAQVVAVVAAAALAALMIRAGRRGHLARLVRAGAIAVALAILLVGAAAAVSFDAAFLLFHQVLFPQGNFLFAPGSNLLVIYPEAYWYGITLRIVASLFGLAVLVALAGHLILRRSGGATLAPAIVSLR